MKENATHELNQVLKALHLPTVRKEFSDQARIAETESLSYEDYLLVLMEQEKDY